MSFVVEAFVPCVEVRLATGIALGDKPGRAGTEVQFGGVKATPEAFEGQLPGHKVQL
jgi:hypothetical protein